MALQTPAPVPATYTCTSCMVKENEGFGWPKHRGVLLGGLRVHGMASAWKSKREVKEVLSWERLDPALLTLEEEEGGQELEQPLETRRFFSSNSRKIDTSPNWHGHNSVGGVHHVQSPDIRNEDVLGASGDPCFSVCMKAREGQLHCSLDI